MAKRLSLINWNLLFCLHPSLSVSSAIYTTAHWLPWFLKQFRFYFTLIYSCFSQTSMSSKLHYTFSHSPLKHCHLTGLYLSSACTQVERATKPPKAMSPAKPGLVVLFQQNESMNEWLGIFMRKGLHTGSWQCFRAEFKEEWSHSGPSANNSCGNDMERRPGLSSSGEEVC